MYQTFGVRPEDFEATYAAYLELLHPEDRALAHDTVSCAVKEGTAYAFDHRVLRPDGTVRWVHSRGEVELGSNGDPVLLAGVAIDITDRKRTEAVLEEFVATAAHELRTPIASLVHALELLTGGTMEEDERAEIYEVLVRQTDRLRRLSGDLLDLTTVEHEVAAVHLRGVPLRPAVEAALALCPAGEITCLVDLPDEPTEVRADEQHLGRVLREVLSAAIGRARREVSISAEQENAEVVVLVSDDGPEFDVQAVDDLFLPVMRGLARSVDAGGGLAVAARIMNAFGGRLEHRPTDEGACFALRFATPRDSPRA